MGRPSSFQPLALSTDHMHDLDSNSFEFCGPAGTYRRQLKQDQVINFIGKLISGDADGAGRAIAQLSTSKDVAGIASALTNAASLVSSSNTTLLDSTCSLSFHKLY